MKFQVKMNPFNWDAPCRQEQVDWIMDNIGDREVAWRWPTANLFEFKRSKDAMFFILRWK